MKNYLCLVDEYELPEGYDSYWFGGEYCINAIEWCVANDKTYHILPISDLQFEDICDIKVGQKIIS